MLKEVMLMQVLDARNRQSIPNVMRWYNTMLSHPTISEFTGTPSLPPVTSSASSSAASHSETNGVLEGKSKASMSSESQRAGTPIQQASVQHSPGKGQQDKANGSGNGQQDKPKGKGAKGGKLAKNDVAKGQKKGGDKKEKPSQAPKGTHSLPASYPPLAVAASFNATPAAVPSHVGSPAAAAAPSPAGSPAAAAAAAASAVVHCEYCC